MSDSTASLERRFYRDTERAMLGGVCAGIAHHFGVCLTAVRIIAVVGFFMATPIAVIAYLTIVWLVPARAVGKAKPSRRDRRRSRHSRWREREERPAAEYRMREVRQRSSELDARLARLERYVTSGRYQLDREFDRL